MPRVWIADVSGADARRLLRWWNTRALTMWPLTREGYARVRFSALNDGRAIRRGGRTIRMFNIYRTEVPV